MRRSAAPSAARSKNSVPQQPPRHPQSNPLAQQPSQAVGASDSNSEEISSDGNRSTSRILSLLSGNAEPEAILEVPPHLTRQNQPKTNREVSSTIKFEDDEVQDKQGEEEMTKVFEAVYRKMQTKKHKTWEGDGKVEVTGRSVVLKDESGKVMGRIEKVKDDIVLEEGAQLAIGGKEVELLGLISSSRPMSSKRPAEIPIGGQARKKRPRDDQEEEEEWRLEMPQPSHKHQLACNKQGLAVNRVVVDGFLARRLRPHQREGVQFLFECVTGMHSDHRGALLADEMGLGKTVQCIALIWTLMRQNVYGRDPLIRRVLIVAPSSLVRNWDREIVYWLKMNRLQAFLVADGHTFSEYRRQRLSPVAVVSYETLVKQMDEALQVKWDLLIFDEAHRLKNPKTKTSKELRRLGCLKRIILTGSPCQNNLMEYFELLDFTNPGILGTRSEFQAEFANPIERGSEANASNELQKFAIEQKEELRRLTSSFVLGRPAEINCEFLPPKQDLVIFCPLSPLQKEMYLSAVEAVGAAYGDDEVRRAAALGVDGCNALCTVMTLRQVCAHPRLLLAPDADNKDGPGRELRKRLRPLATSASAASQLEQHSTKVAVVAGILRFLSGSDRPKDRVVLVSYFTQTLDVLQDLCKSLGLCFSRIDGSVPASERSKLVTQFNDPNSKIFIMLVSAKAGGTGLNLDGASRLILFDIDWNPANDAQCLARVWRGRQKRPVITYRLLSSGTIEEKMFQRQIQKSVWDPTKKSSSGLSFSKEELKDLFSYNESDELENATHRSLGCKCSSDGTNVDPKTASLELLGPLSEQLFEAEDLGCRFPSIGQLPLWQHHAAPHDPQLMEDLNLSLASEQVLFMFRSQLLQQ